MKDVQILKLRMGEYSSWSVILNDTKGKLDVLREVERYLEDNDTDFKLYIEKDFMKEVEYNRLPDVEEKDK